MVAPAILWFRRDLRLADNLALAQAVSKQVPVVPLFIWAPDEDGAWSPGGASRVWLHRALEALQQDLESCGAKLIIKTGASARVLLEIASATGASIVYFNECFEPAARARDASVSEALNKSGISVETFNSSLLFHPRRIQTKEGNPYKVFTPFWRLCQLAPEPDEPLVPPRRIISPAELPPSVPLQSLKLLPSIHWDDGIKSAWTAGSSGALRQLEHFLDGTIVSYGTDRDRPDRDGVSRLSPYLHSGEISARQIWHAVKERTATIRSTAQQESVATYLKELGWREFAYHLLYHFPHTESQPLHKQFERFPWRDDTEEIQRWQKGLTGFPIVDAGMRQLWTLGWMHNRVRMIVASFLVKDLLISWQSGARWFWDTLVDADLASNTLGWQWAAGCGADAAPYFRIFNPVTQSQKFDPNGKYIKEWVPELKDVPASAIHSPWTAAKELERVGVTLGKTYPYPMVDHAIARKRALDALSAIKEVKSS